MHIQRIQRAVDAAHDARKRDAETREALDDAIADEALRIAEDIGLHDPERGFQFVESGDTPLHEVRLCNGETVEHAATLAALYALRGERRDLAPLGDALVRAIAQTSEIREQATQRVLR